jgi:hypothetical protein
LLARRALALRRIPIELTQDVAVVWGIAGARDAGAPPPRG